MYNKQVSATATTLVMFTAAMLLFTGPASHSAGLNEALGSWSGSGAALMCHMPVLPSETYGQTFSRTLYETELALLMPFDAPDCTA